ncbi:MAG: hypothetical protein ACLGIE_01350 [Alphaproteobacteria bacterium]
MCPTNPDRKVMLLNEAALDLPLEMLGAPGDLVIVAGSSLVRMTLAELSLPGAQMIWTDFRQSASLRHVHGAIHELGGLDRLVLGGNGQDGEAMFSVMCAVLTFLPALRRRSGADIILAIQDGPALGSLRAFLQGMTARLRKDRIRVLLQIMPKPFHPVAA